jgi:hypothetical protein
LDGGSDDVYYSHSSGTMSERSMDSITFENNRDIITKIYVYGCQILFQKSLRRHDKIKKALFFTSNGTTNYGNTHPKQTFLFCWTNAFFLQF